MCFCRSLVLKRRGLYKPRRNPFVQEIHANRSDLAGNGLIGIPPSLSNNRNNVPAVITGSAEQSFNCPVNLRVCGEERRNHNRGQFLLWCLHIVLIFYFPTNPYLYTSNIPHTYHIAKFIFMKSKTSFTLSEETLRLLKLIADKENRSQANMIEVLVQAAAKERKIK